MRTIVAVIVIFQLCYPDVIEATSIVNSHHVYTYDEMQNDLKTIKEKYNESLQLQVIGRSHKERNIYAAKIGRGNGTILIVGSHHGREWLSTILVMKMLEQYAISYNRGEAIEGYPSSILDQISICFIPMLNPDGVSIQQKDFTRLSNREKLAIWKMNNFNINFDRWKANAEGVDLNRQYPAGWQNVKTDVNRPFYRFYKGKHPLEAKEASALAAYTRKLGPIIAVAYHTSGREIFWHYHNKPYNLARDYYIAMKTSMMTGYSLSKPEKNAQGSGFTDWFITEFGLPAMTIELSYLVEETNPPLSVFREEWLRNKRVPIMLANEAMQIKLENN
jgi:g-D-glutamyl-meso-diaminopimelate peptidase